MDKEPRLLIWNYRAEEKLKLDAFLRVVGAPGAVAIEQNQGNCTLTQIIDGNCVPGDDLNSDEKVILFYNIPQKGIYFLINALKETGLPRPIYAVVTEHSRNWAFSELLDHLVEERANMEKLCAEKEVR